MRERLYQAIGSGGWVPLVGREGVRGFRAFEGGWWESGWGWFPVLSLVSALGMVLLALAHGGARYDAPWASQMYWGALVVMVVPLATRLVVPTIARHEAIAIVMVLGVVIYFMKLLQSPLLFTFFDEFLHWRTANDILQTGHLFQENSLLPVSPLYPGLEVVTTAVARLTGLSVFASGAIVVGAARLVVMLALFLFCEQVSGSVRVAGVATAIYTSNPHFVIFDGQFAYESLALAFSLTLFRTLLLRQFCARADRAVLSGVAVLILWSLVATHHATSYIASAFLVVWAAVTVVFNRWGRRRFPGMVWLAGLAILVNVFWLLGVASITIGYLAPHLEGTIRSIMGLIAGEGSDRQLFKANNGVETPLFLKLLGLGAPGLITLCFPLGMLGFWRFHRGSNIAFVLALGALLYPATMLMRLTSGGWEVSARSSVFVFIPLAFILALGIEYLVVPWPLRWLRRYLERFRLWLFAPFIGVLFCGGIIAGWSPWALMPWPYHVGADTRSIEPQGLAAARWASQYLGPNNRIAADRINTTLMGTYGEQRMITNLIDKVTISGVFLASHIGPNEAAAIYRGRIRYIVVDERVSTGLPLDGHYYEGWEKLVVPFSGPVNPIVLRKFDTMRGVSRVFDGGVLRVYDVRVLGHEP